MLLEHDYRAAMMREVARPHWIAPALASGASFLEPLQSGGVKTMGIHKPWSPSRSYGLVVRLDAACSRSQASTAAPTAGATASPASSRPAAGSWRHRKGGNAILAIDARAEAGA